ncbi:MAG: hypothetical protein DSM106950_01750 [Stigonema ocellatum SAG 48.90 = DSM 106950]|nr:hypothetical protein [Stigonema ocellatum SAG 48.90 = DSM 106950]
MQQQAVFLGCLKPKYQYFDNAVEKNASLQITKAGHHKLANFIAPSTPIEQQVAEIWFQVLKLEPIGTQDNFFELGGSSLLATQVIQQLSETFSVNIPLEIFVESPTITQLVLHIENLRWLNLKPQSLQLTLKIENLRLLNSKPQSLFEQTVDSSEEGD